MNIVKLCKYFPSFEEGKNNKDWKALKEDYLGKKTLGEPSIPKEELDQAALRAFKRAVAQALQEKKTENKTLQEIEELQFKQGDVILAPLQIFKEMKRLSSIIFSDSPITDISIETGEIKSLKKLRFTKTPFLKLNLAPLENLTHLTLEVYKGALPKSGWPELKNLEVLNLEYNFFNSLPEKIFHCSARIISLFCSGLTALPDFPQKSRIEELDLGGNKLESLPKSLAHLQKLKRLDLTSNPIMVLPKFLNELKNLTYLGLEDTCVFSTVDLSSTQLKSFELREEKEFQLPENFKVIKEHLPESFFEEDGDLESIQDRLYTKIPPKKS